MSRASVTEDSSAFRILAIIILLAVPITVWLTAPVWWKSDRHAQIASSVTPALQVLTGASMEAFCRPPGEQEVAQWNAGLFDKTDPLPALLATAEAQRAHRIRAIYLRALGRDPFDGDCAAVRGWLDRPVGREQIERRLAASREGRRVAEVRQAFIETLGRDPSGWDHASLRYWVESRSRPAEINAGLAAQRPLVGAYYFTWYRFADNHWGNGATAIHAGAPQPTLGWYTSTHTAVMDMHIAQMTAAGFDFVVVNVTADAPDSWANARQFFGRLLGRPLKAAVMVDGLYGAAAGKAHWVQKAQSEFTPHPNYFSYHGAPLIMLFASRLNLAVDGAVLRNVYWTNSYGPGTNTFNPYHALYPHDWPFWSPSPQPLVNGIVPVFPGYVDTHLERTERMEYPRNDGQLYREQWQRALSLRPELIIVYSWNEHFEQSAIEPTNTWGDHYTHLTACYIARAHTGTSEPCP